ncbi:hypothetical protein FHU38_001481 [Saccharomonospora amisosensis]|uniref:DUF5302 domain-containing protein n=1 Tax=Saccharomonospora amisosensis TaxID=1128677 RepID=A0A7X5UNR3_9PSEU|nr:DUF5302 domain-containing protein [Saccharomonospora amisosensis]NIJ11137.1 hypothetical protein [Saccharomonospora amisosensis]
MTEPAPSGEDEHDADVKRKFREALRRKQAKAKAGAPHENFGSRITQAHGPAAHKRDFRRKSG